MGYPPADVLILTAKPVEEAAARQAFAPVQRRTVDSRGYWIGEIGSHRFAHMSLNGAGNVNAAHETRVAVDTWSPAYVILTGIAASVGRRNDVELGDVLVAEQMIDYEPGRDAPEGLQPRWELYRPDWHLLALARSIEDVEWIPLLRQPRPVSRRTAPTVHFGPVASGEKVHAGGSGIDRLRHAWPTAVGLEMEAIGVALASYRTKSRPRLLVAKAVCDFADEAKDDAWQPYAAEAAAQFVAAIVRRLPPRSGSATLPSPARYSGKTKVLLCRRLTLYWQDLADYFGIRQDERARFDQGRGPHGVWDWLAERERLHELPLALVDLGLAHLVSILLTSDTD